MSREGMARDPDQNVAADGLVIRRGLFGERRWRETGYTGGGMIRFRDKENVW